MKKKKHIIFAFGRKAGNFFPLIIAAIFTMLIICCILFFFVPDLFAGATENFSPPDYKGAGIAVLISAVMMVILFFCFKRYVEKRTRRDNIVQLKLLNRTLFDSFDNLLKEGGLLEKAWNCSPTPYNEIKGSAFQRELRRARDLMQEAFLKDYLKDFELVADHILSKGLKASSKVIANCEKEGFFLVERLLGTYFVKINFEELELMLHNATYDHYILLEDNLLQKFEDNMVCIYSFEEQLNLVKEFLSHRNNLGESPGLLRNINDLSYFIFTRSKVELN